MVGWEIVVVLSRSYQRFLRKPLASLVLEKAHAATSVGRTLGVRAISDRNKSVFLTLNVADRVAGNPNVESAKANRCPATVRIDPVLACRGG